MRFKRADGMKKIRAAVILVFICFAALVFFQTRSVQVSGGTTEVGEPVAVENLEIAEVSAKYTNFPHSKHRQNCSSCHKFPSSNWKRVRKDPFPDITDYPRHESCLSCHRQQFFGRAKPQICSICHTNPSPRNSTRRPFPKPGTNSDFAVDFPHETHIDVVAKVEDKVKTRSGGAVFVKANWQKKSEDSCTVCHQTYQPQGDSEDEYMTPPPKDLGDAFWLKKGTFKSSPQNHATCFTCHSTDVGIKPAPTDCAVCHKPRPRSPKADFDVKTAAPMKIGDTYAVATWRTRHSSATFRHEWSSHAEMECGSCHNAASIKLLDFKTTKVDVMSCSMCHITETSDDGGILNYEVDQRKANPAFQCVKCHISFGKLPVPDSHIKAIAAQAGG